MAGEGGTDLEKEHGRAADAVVRELAELVSREGPGRRPTSTYRLQLRPGFGFDEAARVLPYLAALGVSDLYVSPPLAAAPGSGHGYDVVDHGRLNPELGGEEAFERLARACAGRGMGLLVDFVPNHMGIGPRNSWWMDVLENGPSSVWAPAFDVDWTPLKTELGYKVLVPILGDQFGRVLERGELVLAREGGALVVRYFDNVFPVAPRSVPQVLRHRLADLRAELGAGDVHYQELESICASLEKLAPRTDTAPDAIADRAREKEVAKRRLAALCDASPRVRRFVDDNVAVFNGRPGEARSFDLLERLLDAQAYRLAFWRVAGEEINYRRFFDVNGLAAIRMEEPFVFAAAHRLALSLVESGKATGLRIDHPDGLYDPRAYFRRLQASYLLERARRLALERRMPAGRVDDLLLPRIFAAMDEGKLPAKPLYVVVEKILVAPEKMPDGWDVDGTTGYEFLATVNGLFVAQESERAFDGIWARISGRREDFRDVAADKKRLVMSSSMASEVNMLAHRLNQISEMNRRTRDFTLNELTRALIEVVAQFPVYRTYASPRGELDDRDRALVEQAIARARRRSPVVDPSIYDFIRDVILLRYPEGLSDAERRDWLEFTLKLQQVTGPVTAKAVEDTAFYTYLRLVSLNEVGGEPRKFGSSPEEVHALFAERRERFPASLNATSTHDTKRSEDVRVRIDALSEVPGEWRSTLVRWQRTNAAHLTEENGHGGAPDRVDELLLYQTLVGAFPDGGLRPGTAGFSEFVSRIQAYMEKAMREAKRHTSWTSPNEPYEAAVKRFVERILSSGEFLADLRTVAGRVAHAGRISSLAQVAVKCAAPGVPDVYQGCELWDLSLVDPDNRRPVDFALRARALADIERELERGAAARAALAKRLSSGEGLQDGRAKLLLLRVALHLRQAMRELFLGGDYLPLLAEGPLARRVFAFARVDRRHALVCAVPRLVLGALDAGGGRVRWEGALPLPKGLPTRWRDAITGVEHEGHGVALAELFASFPVALLVSEARQ